MVDCACTTDLESWVTIGKHGIPLWTTRKAAFLRTALSTAVKTAKCAALAASKTAETAAAVMMPVAIATLLRALRLFADKHGRCLLGELRFPDDARWDRKRYEGAQDTAFEAFVKKWETEWDLWCDLSGLMERIRPTVVTEVVFGEPKTLTIEIQNAMSETTTLILPSGSLVWDMKKKLSSVWGVAIEEQHLWSEACDDELQNHKTVWCYTQAPNSDRSEDDQQIPMPTLLTMISESFEKRIQAALERFTEPHDTFNESYIIGRCYECVPRRQDFDPHFVDDYDNEWFCDCEMCSGSCSEYQYETSPSKEYNKRVRRCRNGDMYSNSSRNSRKGVRKATRGRKPTNKFDKAAARNRRSYRKEHSRIFEQYGKGREAYLTPRVD